MLGFMLSPGQLGVIASFVATLLSLAPFFGATDLRRNVTAILAIILGAFLMTNFHYTTLPVFLSFFGQVLIYAVVSYKGVFQNFVSTPIANAIGRSNYGYASRMGLNRTGARH